MSDFDKIVKNSFNESSLDQENWLEPSDAVFENIQSAIEKKEKRRSPWIWLWLFPIAILFTFSFYFLTSQSEDTDLIGSSEQTEEILPTKTSAQSAGFNTISTENNTIEKPSTLKDISEEKVNNIHSNIPQSSSENKIQRTILASTLDKSSPQVLAEAKLANQNNSTLSKQASFSNIGSNPLNDLIPKGPSKKIIKQSPISIVKKDNTPLQTTWTLTKLAILPMSIQSNEDETFSFNLPMQTLVKKDKMKTRNKIEISSSLIFWQDKLNQNYTAALAPADFTNGNAIGAGIGLSYSIPLIKNIDFGIEVAYQAIKNRSGHNAGINYSEAQEVNLTNSFNDIQLATPYGFVQSDFNIRRSEAATETDVELMSSVHSVHYMKFISISPQLIFTVFSNDSWEFNVNSKLGYHHLLDIRNELDFINTNHDHFRFGQGSITIDQSGLASGYWSAGLDLSVLHHLNNNLDFGLSYGQSSALNPIFKDNDFSSSVKTKHMSLLFRYKF